MRVRVWCASIVGPIVVAFALAAFAAHADETSEKEARALFEQGNTLVEQGDYVDALERFRAAYARWANPKILINIGTTLRQLGRFAEAADTYEAWLKDPGADAKRRAEIEGALTELDAKIGKIKVEVKDGEAHILVDGRDVGVAAPSLVVRVEPGSHAVVADREGEDAVARTVAVGAGETHALSIGFVKRAVAPPIAPPTTTTSGKDADASTIEPPTTHARMFGVFARTDIDPSGRGAVFVPAVTYGVIAPVELVAAALVGKNKGAEPGVTFYLLRGAFSPRIGLAMPMFFVDGARVGVRGGGGLQYDPSRHFGVFVDASAAYFPSAPDGVDRAVFLATVGAQVRF